MFRKSLSLVGLLLCYSLAFAAAPGIDEVYQAAKAGKLTQAKAMMQEVLKEHPNSGRAHYVNAHILARNSEYAAAATELKQAEALSPGLEFANPKAVSDLRALLASHVRGDPALLPALSSPGNGQTNWTLILIIVSGVVGVLLIMRAVSNYNRNAATLQPQYNLPNTNGATPNPTMAPPYAQPPAGGSALKSGLATGLGVAAGMVAGQAIANSLFGNHPSTNLTNPDVMPPDANLGGQDFGLNDKTAWDDSSSMSDIGNDFSDGGGDWS